MNSLSATLTDDSDDQLIFTDSDGNISNITLAVKNLLGLSPLFFKYDPENFITLTRIDNIASMIFDDYA